MKKYSISNVCSPCVGFKYGFHDDKDITWVLTSRSWEFDFKRRIQDMALSRYHDRPMSWSMVDHGLEQAIK
jgi:hypothetical protein